jgi:hypothetical protein
MVTQTLQRGGVPSDARAEPELEARASTDPPG